MLDALEVFRFTFYNFMRDDDSCDKWAIVIFN